MKLVETLMLCAVGATLATGCASAARKADCACPPEGGAGGPAAAAAEHPAGEHPAGTEHPAAPDAAAPKAD
ncbi:MAG: hypothetical protein A2138_27140 [Deltaproteobacteria bacterium RBG_16_71_12]|nr:MAG: hypothetical protein A2138_27140 [Deltaproteobacteria bacterium RBG_16_71_12]